jgi:uncharacterized membrane protein
MKSYKGEPILIDSLLVILPIEELLDLYYRIRWHVEEIEEYKQNEHYQDYLNRIKKEFQRRAPIMDRNK